MMRAQISINKLGVIRNTTSSTTLSGGVLLSRKNTELTITISTSASFKSLIMLIQTLRAIDQKLQLVEPNQEPQSISRSKLCVMLAQRALSLLERERECPFTSELEVIDRVSSVRSNLTVALTNLANLVVTGLDTPTALIKASTLNIPHLTSIAQNRAMRLFFMALPPTMTWPVIAPRTRHPIDGELDELTCRWLSLVYETVLSTRHPLLHHGTIALTPNKKISFQRILYPITPTNERPGNYRILSAAACLTDPDIILI